MGMQTLEFGHDHADVEGPWRRSQLCQRLQRLTDRERVHVGADAANTLHQRDHLRELPALGEVFDPPEIETDAQFGVVYGFSLTEQINLIGLLECGMIRANWDAVAHSSSLWRLTPTASPTRKKSGSYSRPAKSTARYSWISRSIQSAAGQRSQMLAVFSAAVVVKLSSLPSRSQW